MCIFSTVTWNRYNKFGYCASQGNIYNRILAKNILWSHSFEYILTVPFSVGHFDKQENSRFVFEVLYEIVK